MVEQGSAATPREALRERAVKRVEAKKAFWGQLAVFGLVNVIAWVVWGISKGWRYSDIPWPLWLLVWGIFVAWHGVRVFADLGGPARQDEVEKEMRRLGGS